MVDVKCLSDYELQNELNKLGFSPGPILSSTRTLYENKLMQLLVSPPCASPTMNGPGKQHRTQDYEDREALFCPGMNRIHYWRIFVAGSYVLMAYFPFVSHDPDLRGIIILKGNIILSSEKKKGPRKNPVFEMQAHQEELVKPNSDYNDSKMIRKRPKAFTTKPKPQHIYCQHHKHAEKIRWASGAPYTRFRERKNTEENAYCTTNGSAGSRNLERFPVGLKLAVFGIFIIVIFVYITVEKKPLFG